LAGQPSHFVLPPTRCALRRDTDGLAGQVLLERERLRGMVVGGTGG